MSWQIIPLVNGLKEWRGDWDKLNERIYGGHPFHDSRFVDGMLRHFGGGSEHMCVHRSEGRIDGMLLLYPRKMGIWSQFVPAQAQAVPLLIERREFLRELFSFLPRSVFALEFLCQDPNYAPGGLLAEDATTRLSVHALTLNIEVRGSFEEYWAGRSKKLVQNMRRYQRRVVDELGIPQLKVLRDPRMMHQAVQRYGWLESAGWKGRVGTAIGEDNVQGHFYREVMERFAETGQAEAVECWIGDRLVASRLLIIGGGMIVMLKTAYDEEFSKYAPGRLLLKEYVQHVFAGREVGAVEFYTDATPDQLTWSTGQRHIYHVMIFRAAYQARLYKHFQDIKARRHSRASTEEYMKAETLRPRRIETSYCAGGADLPAGGARLFSEAEKDSFDLSADWYRLMESRAVTPDIQPRYCVFTRDGDVLGVMPVFLRRLPVWGRQAAGMTSFYSSLHRPPLSPSLTADDLADGLRQFAAAQGCSILRFDAMDPAHPSFDLLESALRKAGFSPYRFFCFGNWYLPVQNRSFSEYFNGLPSRLRNSALRGQRKFYADGRGRLELVTGENIERAIEHWKQVYDASWKVPEPFPEFVPGLIRLCAARGWLRLGMAYYDDKPVAAQLWIVSHGRAAIYKLAYDEKMAKLSIGTVLSAYLMAHALDVDKVTEVDYLIGDDAYKKDWMSHRRERWGLVAYDPRTLAGLAGLTGQVAGNLRKALRQSQASSAAFKKAGEGGDHVGHD